MKTSNVNQEMNSFVRLVRTILKTIFYIHSHTHYNKKVIMFLMKKCLSWSRCLVFSVNVKYFLFKFFRKIKIKVKKMSPSRIRTRHFRKEEQSLTTRVIQLVVHCAHRFIFGVDCRCFACVGIDFGSEPVSCVKHKYELGDAGGI